MVRGRAVAATFRPAARYLFSRRSFAAVAADGRISPRCCPPARPDDRHHRRRGAAGIAISTNLPTSATGDDPRPGSRRLYSTPSPPPREEPRSLAGVFLRETVRTRAYVDALLRRASADGGGDDHRDEGVAAVFEDVASAERDILRRSSSRSRGSSTFDPSSEAEVGPAGRYAYWTVLEGGGEEEEDGGGGSAVVEATYRRPTSNDGGGRGCDVVGAEVVMTVDIREHRSGPPATLSADEEWVAHLRVTAGAATERNGSGEIVVRDIRSGVEGTFAPPFADVVNVEFGPPLPDADTDGQRPAKRHALFFTTCDISSGRPDATFRVVASLTEEDGDDDRRNGGGERRRFAFSEPALIYRESDPAFHVDLRRTKGGYHVAVTSSSKTEDEVRIVGSGEAGGRGGEEEEEYYRGAGLAQRPSFPSVLLVREREKNVRYRVDVGEDGDVLVLAHLAMSPPSSSPSPAAAILGEETRVFAAMTSELPLRGFGEELLIEEDDDDDDDDGARGGRRHFVEDVDLFTDHLVLYERSASDGAPRVRVCDRTVRARRRGRGNDGGGGTAAAWSLAGEARTIVPAAHPGTAAPGREEFLRCSEFSPSGNVCYRSSTIAIRAESPVVPPVVGECNMASGEWAAHNGEGNVAGKGAEYAHEMMAVTSVDGTRVFMSLIYRKFGVGAPDAVAPLLPPRRRPAVLTGYGSYGVGPSLRYDPAVALLVDIGFVAAFAHTRGGSERGNAWYRRGRGAANKARTVEDFVACAEALAFGGHVDGGGGDDGGPRVPRREESEEEPRRWIAARCSSAGGVVVGAALNAVPDLFGAAVMTNPFLDVVAAAVESDPASCPLAEHERAEWGDPARGGDEAAMRRYCPVSNVRPSGDGGRRYPPTLLTAALDDNRVPFWHAATYAEKRRAAGGIDGGAAPVLLNVVPVGGHELHGSRLGVSALEASFVAGEFYFHRAMTRGRKGLRGGGGGGIGDGS